MFNSRIDARGMPPKVRIWYLTLVVVLAVGMIVAIACGGNEAQDSEYVIPTPTPGTLPPTQVPKLVESGDSYSLEIFVGGAGYTQQGTATLSPLGSGSRLTVSVRPAPGAVQLVSIREGTCDEIGKWIESVEHAVGGESLSELTDLSPQDLLDGNHVVTLSIPDGGLSEYSACGEFPEFDLESIN